MKKNHRPDIEFNEVLDRLPAHLLQFVKPQNYEHYTAIDQAVWRYVMHKNVSYLKEVAHESYLEGLKKTGISLDRIPSMYGMNRILKKIGWAAVAVDGLIPTAAFLEFQAYNVLVIASEIRSVEDIEYTPIPDIIHESAGHAPIIANPEYAEFLRRVGQIGCKAISSAKDRQLQSAVRKLTELKIKSETGEKEDLDALKEGEENVVRLQQDIQELSEMSAIRNLHWWSVEYGLIGKPDDYKIYGAGLLSSIGESKWCRKEEVKKLPFSVEAASYSFDYTKPQPQLFVTPHFPHLSFVLEEYADTMAIRLGGLSALEKLIESEELGTIELNTGIQISGIFSRVIKHDYNQVAYFQTIGPTALSYREKELVGHGTKTHQTGFGTPIGKLKGINLAIEDMSPRDLDVYDIYEGRRVTLQFEGGLSINGEVVTGVRNLKGKIILIRFKDCTVYYRDEILFSPGQGDYHMAVGSRVVSGFAGPADEHSFDLITHELSKSGPDPSDPPLEDLYDAVRLLREEKLSKNLLNPLMEQYLKDGSDHWLVGLELLEMLRDDQGLAAEVKESLTSFARTHPEKAHLIKDGLNIVSGKALSS